MVSALTAVALLLATPSAAAASAGDTVELSADGTRFSTSLPSGLFDLSGGLVPADEETGHFWVRNSTPRRAYLRLALARAHVPNRSLASALRLSTVVDGISGIRLSLGSVATCTVLGRATAVEPGAIAAVDVVLTLGDLAGSAAQRTTASFSLAVSLSDVPPESSALAACAPSSARVPVTSSGRHPSPAPESIVESPPFSASPPLGGDWTALWPIVGLALGGLAFAGIARRKNRQKKEVAP